MSRGPIQLAALCAAVSIGAASGVSANGCLLPEECILTISHGENWCTHTQDALMWPAGQPELAVPVLYEGTLKSPEGCRCYNAAEQEILWGQVPEATYEAARADIEQATRDECDFVVPLGWDHNCYLEGPGDVEFAQIHARDYGDCVGACHYLGPKCPEPGEINPYECDELYGDGETGQAEESGEAGGADETGPEDPAQPPGGEDDMQWRF